MNTVQRKDSESQKNFNQHRERQSTITELTALICEPDPHAKFKWLLLFTAAAAAWLAGHFFL